MKSKKCSKCKLELPSTSFSKDKTKKSGLSSQCKKCKKVYMKSYYKEYYEENKDTILKKNRKWAKNHKEDMLRWGREYYSRNREAQIQKGIKWREENTEKHKAWRAEYSKRDSVVMSSINQSGKRRVAKRISSDGTIPQEVRDIKNKALFALLEKQNYKCAYCNCDIREEKHLDHIIPISKGGVHSIENVIWSCPTCNLKKSDKIA